MEDMEQYILHLQSEGPKIDEAMKNIIAMIVGRSLTTTDTDAMGSDVPTYTPTQALTCARIVLKAIQEVELMDYLPWTEANPQLPNQTAIERIEQLTKYKAVLFLRDRVLTSNQSINKFFSKSYFTWTNSSEMITSSREADLDSLTRRISDKSMSLREEKVPADHLQNFLKYFLDSLQKDDLGGIVWSKDFQMELYNRSQKRQQQIQQRDTSEDSYDREVASPVDNNVKRSEDEG